MSISPFKNPQPLLAEVQNLSIGFNGGQPLVRNVSFSIKAGQCVALVGESGSGKSITARSLLGLSGSGAQISADRFQIAGRDALSFSEPDWRSLRGTSQETSPWACTAVMPPRPVARTATERSDA